jgi:hypothetical protein
MSVTIQVYLILLMLEMILFPSWKGTYEFFSMVRRIFLRGLFFNLHDGPSSLMTADIVTISWYTYVLPLTYRIGCFEIA